jgi:hypothetical protein
MTEGLTPLFEVDKRFSGIVFSSGSALHQGAFGAALVVCGEKDVVFETGRGGSWGKVLGQERRWEG